MTSPAASVQRHAKARGAFEHYKIDRLTSQLYDLVKAMEAKYGGTLHRRQLDAEGAVRVAFERANGDRLAADGADMASALQNLHTRLEAWPVDA